MDKGKQSIKSSIIEISSKDNVTKEITMLVHKIDSVNGNGLDFKLDYVEKYKDSIINRPVVCRYYPLKDDLGDHEAVFDSNGNIIGLETIAIGTIKEAWIDDFEVDANTTVKALYTKADLWNYKYPEIVACVEKLVNSNNADSSVEVEIYAYEANASQEYRACSDYTYLSNCLLGSSVTPADSDAGVISVAQREIASAVNKDLQNLNNEQKGDGEMSEGTKEVFNKGYETKFHGELETSALKFSEVRSQFYNIVNPLNPASGNRTYNFYIRDMYTEYAIVEDWYDEKTLYKIPYSITNDQVVVSPSDQWQKGYLGFIPEGIVVATLISDKEIEISNLQDQLTKTKEELASMEGQQNEAVVELETKISELEAKITELNAAIVSKEEEKLGLESQITELNSKVEELAPFKEAVEKAEKDVKVAELSSRYEKLLSQEMFKSEEVQAALTELNEVQLNEIVVSEIAKQKETVEVSSKEDKSVTIVASKQEDLIPQNILQKYGIEA